MNSDYAGHRLTFQLFAQAPPFAHLNAVYRNFRLGRTAGFRAPLGGIIRPRLVIPADAPAATRPLGSGRARRPPAYPPAPPTLPPETRACLRPQQRRSPAPKIRFCGSASLVGMSHAACTVNVVTTDGPAGRHGVTVSAMVSVSADTPRPTLLVCIHYLSPAAAAVLQNKVFCVNVLREDQSHISDSFAGRSGAQGEAKFDCAQWTTQLTGAPQVARPWLHSIAVSPPVSAWDRISWCSARCRTSSSQAPGAPLIYANRAYGVPQHFAPRTAAVPRPATADAQLTLGCFQTFAAFVVPELAARLLKVHSAVELRIVEAGQSALLAQLRSGETDIALLYDFGLGDDIQREFLAELKPYVLLPGRSCAGCIRRGGVAGPGRRTAHRPGCGTEPRLFSGVVPRAGLTPRLGMRAGSVEMVRGLVAHGLGYSLLATKPANNMSYDGRALTTRPLIEPASGSRLVLARLAGRPLSPIAAAFEGLCRSFFQGDTHAHAHSSIQHA